MKPQAALYMFPKLDPKMYPIVDDQQFITDLFLTGPTNVVAKGEIFDEDLIVPKA